MQVIISECTTRRRIMNKLQEFWYCVAPQNDIPLYRGEMLDDSVVIGLLAFLNYYRNNIQDTFSKSIQKALLYNPNFINDIRLLLGISNKRFYLDMTYLAHISTTINGDRFVPEKREDLIKHSTAWFVGRLSREGKEEWAKLISGYFLSNDLEQILNAFLSLSENLVKEIFNNLIAPKEIQQKQAKYRGHGAEQLVAKSFFDVGSIIYPVNKHLTPMAERDPNVNLTTMEIVSHEVAAIGIHSFDLIIKDADGDICALVQSLIHTSDPGQYGVNKSDETVEIKKMIDKYNELHSEKPVYLIGNVDGVGFSENPNGTIAKMLGAFDSFVQINTMFKVGLYMQQIGLISGIRYIVLDDDYFSSETKEYFKQKYIEPAGVELVNEIPCNYKKIIRAGRAMLIY